MEIIKFIYKYDGFFELLLGFALIFIGDAVISRFRTGKNAPPLLRFILCTAFTYAVSVIREIAQFLIDFYKEDSALQDYNYAPEENMLFFQLFGHGSAQVGQYHLLDTDLDFICMIAGCALGGGLLLLCSLRKEKKKAERTQDHEAKAEVVSA